MNARLAVLSLFLGLVVHSVQAQQPNALRQQFLESRAKAELGDALAQCKVGNFYYDGQGVEKDYVEAVAWFLKAAEQKFAPAQFKLGICFENGQGVEKNSVEAMRWFHEAAELNDGDAQGILGDRYAAGKGVERNFEKAYAWYNLAAVTSKEAATSRDALEKRMSPQQIAEAQKRTRELRAEIDARLEGK